MINLTIALIISALIYFIVAHHSVMDKLAEKYHGAYILFGLISFVALVVIFAAFATGLVITLTGIKV